MSWFLGKQDTLETVEAGVEMKDCWHETAPDTSWPPDPPDSEHSTHWCWCWLVWNIKSIRNNISTNNYNSIIYLRMDEQHHQIKFLKILKFFCNPRTLTYLKSCERILMDWVLMMISLDWRAEENALRAGYLILGEETSSSVPYTRYTEKYL